MGVERGAYMAVLCESMVFSLSSNSWKTSGLRVLVGSVQLHVQFQHLSKSRMSRLSTHESSGT